VLWGVFLLFVVSGLTFLIFYVFPSADPAALRAGRQATPQLIAQIRHSLGLDKSRMTARSRSRAAERPSTSTWRPD
jgi:peptide/nickel transport system permease protein